MNVRKWEDTSAFERACVFAELVDQADAATKHAGTAKTASRKLMLEAKSGALLAAGAVLALTDEDKQSFADLDVKNPPAWDALSPTTKQVGVEAILGAAKVAASAYEARKDAPVATRLGLYTLALALSSARAYLAELG